MSVTKKVTKDVHKDSESKIIASAQRHYKDVLFQHGAIKINGLTSHPSVLLTNSNLIRGNNIIINESDFITMAELFRLTFETGLEIRMEKERLRNSDKSEVESFCEHIKENALFKRETIKHKFIS